MYADINLHPPLLLNYRIINEGLFQPIIQLSLVKRSDNTITGTANLILKELGREFHQHFKLHGNYFLIPDSKNVLLNIRGCGREHQNGVGLSIEMKLDKDWATGVANYQYHQKTIRNATVSSILFIPTQIKTAFNTVMQQGIL